MSIPTTLAEALEEIERLASEIMEYQIRGPYEKGWDHGALVAARFRDERDAALERVAALEARLAQAAPPLGV